MTNAEFNEKFRDRTRSFAVRIFRFLEEADESEYWLQIIQDLKMGDKVELEALLNEIDEIIRIISTIKQKFKPNQ